MNVFAEVGFGDKKTNLNFQVHFLFVYQDIRKFTFFGVFLIMHLYFSTYMSENFTGKSLSKLNPIC